MSADYHIHTEFSDGSYYPMVQVVPDAVQKGFGEICFTDHVDHGALFIFIKTHINNEQLKIGKT